MSRAIIELFLVNIMSSSILNLDTTLANSINLFIAWPAAFSKKNDPIQLKIRTKHCGCICFWTPNATILLNNPSIKDENEPRHWRWFCLKNFHYINIAQQRKHSIFNNSKLLALFFSLATLCCKNGAKFKSWILEHRIYIHNRFFRLKGRI